MTKMIHLNKTFGVLVNIATKKCGRSVPVIALDNKSWILQQTNISVPNHLQRRITNISSTKNYRILQQKQRPGKSDLENWLNSLECHIEQDRQ